MIRTIEAEYFQSWESLSIDLSPGVNVIKGNTHSGKSGIIRLIKWAALNDPNRGDYFASWSAPKKAITSASIEFDDDSYAIRKKGKGVNSYDLSSGNLPTIGTDLPDEVKAITRMNNINIQTQDEQYFMLRETPGKVAKVLNNLVGLDIIDETLTKLNKLENENNVKVKLLEKESLEIKEGMEELDYVSTLETKVESIETLWEEYQKLSERKSDIIHLSEDIQEEDSFIQDTKEWLAIKEPVQRLKSQIAEKAVIERSLNELKKLYTDIRQAENVRHSSAEQVGKLTKRKSELLKDHADDFCQKCGAYRIHWRKK